MSLRRLRVCPQVFPVLFSLHVPATSVTTATSSSTNNTATTNARRSGESVPRAAARNTHWQQKKNHHYATFCRLLQSMRENSWDAHPSGNTAVAMPPDDPLVANTTLMEQLGVMDLAERRTHQFAVSTAHTDTKTIPTSLSILTTELCKAGVACHLPPSVILRKISEATQNIREGNIEWIPPVPMAMLFRYATERVTAKVTMLQQYKNGSDAVTLGHGDVAWLRSDQGEIARLQWSLLEEMRRGYELLAKFPESRYDILSIHHTNLEEGSKEKNNEMTVQDILKMQRESIDELRSRLDFAVALQDATIAKRIIEKLLAFYGEAQSGYSNEENETLLSNMSRDVCSAISAFRSTRDFTSGCKLYETFLSIMSLSVDTSITANNKGKPTSIARVAERLRLLTALANCVDSNASHFTYVQDEVVKLFFNTDVGYFDEEQQVAQEALCAVVHALSRVTLEPGAKMKAAESFFCTIQQNSQTHVSLTYHVTEALLQVASAARDANVALLLYNQLAAPNVHRADVPANIIAVLLTEQNALRDFSRFVSLMSLHRRVITSAAAHLLAVKLLLERQPSEVLYTVLDMISVSHDVDPQRTFFFRLLVLYRDMQIRMSLNDHHPDVSVRCVHDHTLRILKAWRDELQQRGIRTLAFTTLKLLQHIRRHLVRFMAMLQEGSSEGINNTETISSLVKSIDSILLDFSLGWLNHRSVVTRTPRYHLKITEIESLTVGDQHQDTIKSSDATGVSVRTLSDGVVMPLHAIAALPVERRQTLVRKVSNTLSSAAEAGGSRVVLGFSDYVCLCLLEDASLFSDTASSSSSSSIVLGSSVDGLSFSLDALNNRDPLVYIVDALGEMMLDEDLHAKTSPSPSSSSSVPVVVQRDIKVDDDSLYFPRRPHDGSKEEDWLTQWLDESSFLLPVGGRGVFEDQLELLLRMTPLTKAATQSMENYPNEKIPPLSCFASIA